ncbi:carbon-nitrogen hydrolase [Syntrophus aciditrophicus]|uniref:N-carbamoylputrescine amidase n=1 Tax=Syntrophus aciditrophicus (strain SB) TaxID=56780 RepID=Q2LXF6_SYNAS|nr:carbon-nitrogen hydrolase [Syntrophus aciditrophicus]ABC78764.1 N-carbamoylputrescine amidase [Syntrophus aciditrophicus SB]
MNGKKRKVSVGLIQMACGPDMEQNLAGALEKAEIAAGQGAQILCFQELFTSLYFCDVESYDCFRLAEAVPGPTTERLQALARKRDVAIVASLFEKRAEGLYHNTVAVIDAGGEYLGKYRKMHIPDDPGYYEKFYFTPGDLGYRVFTTRYAKIGTLICWDQWYPEAARITALMGADILFYPTAIGWATAQNEEANREQFDAWQTIQRGHAIANGLHVVAVNRTGREGEMQYWGGSFVSNPLGTVLWQAPHHEEVVHVQSIDLSLTNFYRIHWPFLRDRRIESYGDLQKRFLD